MENNRTSTKPALSVSLALSGGAARGVFHLGFIQALEENGVEIKAISGSSAGALVGGAIACGLKPKEVFDIVKSKKFKKIFKFNWLKKSLLSINLEADILDKLFTADDISKTKIPFYACVSDLKSHKKLHIDKGDGKTFILASCALVPLFKPVYNKDRVLADGGILDLMPTTPLLKYNYPIIGINLMPNVMPKKHTFINLLVRVLQISLTTSLPQNIARCRWYISPKKLSCVKMFSFKDLQKGYDLGYKHGLKWCQSEFDKTKE